MAALPRSNPATIEMLVSHDWSGNVRELKSVVERLNAFPDLGAAALSHVVGGGPVSGNGGGAFAGNYAELLALPFHEAKERVTEAFEKSYLTEHLKAANGVVTHAAQRIALPAAVAPPDAPAPRDLVERRRRVVSAGPNGDRLVFRLEFSGPKSSLSPFRAASALELQLPGEPVEAIQRAGLVVERVVRVVARDQLRLLRGVEERLRALERDVLIPARELEEHRRG